MIHIQVECDPRLESINPDCVRELMLPILNAGGIAGAEITLIFTDDEYLRELKAEYFKVDQYTDVIAFRLDESEDELFEGEIYISLPRARENAQLFSEPFPREIARLIIHGTLHLLGWSDDTPEGKKAMTVRENEGLSLPVWEQILS